MFGKSYLLSPACIYWSAHIDRKLASIVSCFFSLLTITVSYTVIPYTPQQIKNAIFCHYQVNHYRVALYMCVGKTYLLFPACIYWSAHIDRKLASPGIYALSVIINFVPIWVVLIMIQFAKQSPWLCAFSYKLSSQSSYKIYKHIN